MNDSTPLWGRSQREPCKKEIEPKEIESEVLVLYPTDSLPAFALQTDKSGLFPIESPPPQHAPRIADDCLLP